MAYRSLRLQSFRSYGDDALEFNPGITIIVGPNGSGKTNLLEALYVLSTGSSFRGADRELIQRGKEWFRLEGTWEDQQRILTYRLLNGVAEKQFMFDGSKKARLTHHQRLPVVLFEPDHLRLLHAGPSHRRDYLDALLGRSQPDFTWLKHQFERALAQRNNLLRRRLPASQRDDYLFAWDIKFADLAERVVARRQALAGLFNEHLSNVYSVIAGQQSEVRIVYQSTVPSRNYHAALLQLLADNVEHDHARGFTGVGPQRDDIIFNLNGSPAAAAASRGEVRSILLALKMIELQLLARQTDTPPLLLLDDVFSELDTSRRRALAELAKTYQTFITTTDADAITQHFASGYHVIARGSRGHNPPTQGTDGLPQGA